MPIYLDAMFAPTDYVRMYLPSVLLILLILVFLLTVGSVIFLAIRRKRHK